MEMQSAYLCAKYAKDAVDPYLGVEFPAHVSKVH